MAVTGFESIPKKWLLLITLAGLVLLFYLDVSSSATSIELSELDSNMAGKRVQVSGVISSSKISSSVFTFRISDGNVSVPVVVFQGQADAMGPTFFDLKDGCNIAFEAMVDSSRGVQLFLEGKTAIVDCLS